MNKLIKEQLLKVKANIPEFDDNTTQLIITKDMNKIIDVEKDRYYTVEVEDYIIHPYEGFTLNSNWNRNISIDDKHINLCVLDIMGKMIKFEGTGVESGKTYVDMWLPMKSFKVTKTL